MSAAQKCETPLAGGAAQEANQKTDASIIADPGALAARAALKGLTVHRLTCGAFMLVPAICMVHRFDDAHELDAFLRHLEGGRS
jgi:hypothetical protein